MWEKSNTVVIDDGKCIRGFVIICTSLLFCSETLRTCLKWPTLKRCDPSPVRGGRRASALKTLCDILKCSVDVCLKPHGQTHTNKLPVFPGQTYYPQQQATGLLPAQAHAEVVPPATQQHPPHPYLYHAHMHVCPTLIQNKVLDTDGWVTLGLMMFYLVLRESQL